MVTWGFPKPNPFQASHPESPTPGASSCRGRWLRGRLWSRGSWAPTKRFRPWRSCGGSRRAWTWAWPLTLAVALRSRVIWGWLDENTAEKLGFRWTWKKSRWIIMMALGKWWTWPLTYHNYAHLSTNVPGYLPDPQDDHPRRTHRIIKWGLQGHGFFAGTLWWFNITMERSTIFNGKTNYK